MPSENKMINLSQAETLYNDLRDRIEDIDIPIVDVKVDGHSIVNHKEVVIPYATADGHGVVAAGAGLNIEDGTIAIREATSTEISDPSTLIGFTNSVITPRVQGDSTFFGLATAAGDITQKRTNTVGTYTAKALEKIHEMLGAEDIIGTIEKTTSSGMSSPATHAYEKDNLFYWKGKIYKAKKSIAIGDTIDPRSELGNCEITTLFDEIVNDIKVNGTSIVSNNTANIPLAVNGLNSTPGVVKIYDGYGITVGANETLSISEAGPLQVKAGTDSFKPIAPNIQHSATFYGLAKAAGDSTQSSSNNAVGTYTDSAKDSIRKMLGTVADEAIAPTEDDESANRSYSVGNLFIRNGRLYKVTAAIVQDGAIITTGVGKNCEEITITNEFARITDTAATGVTDVEVDGTSVVSNGVAEIHIPVQEVSINNTSIMSNGTANIPLATTGSLGVVKGGNAYGTNVQLDGTLSIYKATDTNVKEGTNTLRPIVPSNQHNAVFYGLAKVAGDTTQSQSFNVEGEYTENAKNKIRAMVNAASADAIAPAENTGNSSDYYDTNDYITVNGKLYKVTSDISPDDAIITEGNGQNCTETSIIETFVKKNDWANNYTPGVVTANGTKGIEMEYATSNLKIVPAQTSDIIGQEDEFKPITSSSAKTAVFYGLAQAAGDMTQALSGNNFGTYTSEAKAAIQSMLDVPSIGDLSDYAEKTDTVLETTLSRGRAANTTVGTGSIAFGNNVEASDDYAFATGNSTVASGRHSKAEGYGSIASGVNSHAEGNGAIANGTNSHAEGKYNVESTIFPEWVSSTHYQEGDGVYHAPTYYICVEENTDTTWTFSHWREYGFSSNVAHVIGNGTSNSSRSNAYMLDWDGNGHYMGDVYVGANANSTGGTKLAKVSDIAVNDVQIDGTSILSSGVANVPVMTNEVYGVAKFNNNYGTGINSGFITTYRANADLIKAGTNIYRPVTPSLQHNSVFYGLAKAAGDSTQSESSNAVGTYTAAAKTAIRNMLGVTDGSIYTETVSGTTPSITGEPNVRYICGEISTLTITPPSAGTIIVRFRSGTSATVLTVQGVNWPGWFDPTSLETSVTYEIMITDGTYGSVMIWPV